MKKRGAKEEHDNLLEVPVVLVREQSTVTSLQHTIHGCLLLPDMYDGVLVQVGAEVLEDLDPLNGKTVRSTSDSGG